jgi:hypothetical protein
MNTTSFHPMNKLVVALVLIVVGVIVIGIGQRRSDSVAGISESVGSKIANAWDGKGRQPDHVWYYVGGGVLILAGIAVGLRKNT